MMIEEAGTEKSGTGEAVRSVKRKRFIVLIVGLVVVLDQFTKSILVHNLPLYGKIVVVPGFFNIVHWRNPGAAFGFLNFGTTAAIAFLIITSVAAIILIGFFIRQAQSRGSVVALSMVAGGAFGNLIDRVRHGEVIDFLDFHAWGYHWPAFNVADSAITVGVAFALLFYYLHEADFEDGGGDGDGGGVAGS